MGAAVVTSARAAANHLVGGAGGDGEDDRAEGVKAAQLSMLRGCVVEGVVAGREGEDFDGKWLLCSSGGVTSFGAGTK